MLHPVIRLERQHGFTLMELLVVFSIIGILASVSVASFVDYSRTQELKAATSEVSTLLSQAKSKAQSQIKPSSCGSSSLEGYEVRICGLVGSSCSTANTYALYVRCGTATSQISVKRLPKDITFLQSETTSVSYFFRVLHRGVEGAGNVALTAYNKTQTISVNQVGAISSR